jgi:hypothetical protein
MEADSHMTIKDIAEYGPREILAGQMISVSLPENN